MRVVIYQVYNIERRRLKGYTGIVVFKISHLGASIDMISAELAGCCPCAKGGFTT
jgi:hypothetical protein